MLNGGASVEDARAVLVGRLRARHGELVDAIFARVRSDAFDRMGDDDAEYVAGLRAAVAVALEYVLDGIERGGEGAGGVPVVAVEQARRAVRNGVGLDTVLRRYVVGQRVLSDFVMVEAEGCSTRVLRGVLDLQGSLVEGLMAVVATEYKREAERAGRSLQQRRAERVRGLLEGGVDADDLGYELDAWHLGVIAVGAGAEGVVRQLAAGVDRRCLSVVRDEHSVWAWLGGRDRLAFVDVERIVGGVDGMGSHPPVVLTLGEPARGLAGWRLTHQQAQAALVVALRRRESRGEREGVTPTRYGDVALLAAALKDELLARALVDIYLSPLEGSRDRGALLLKTLNAYFAAERNATSAAVTLGVVRSTVEGRLRAVETHLGRTLHTHLAELEVALRLRELDDY